MQSLISGCKSDSNKRRQILCVYTWKRTSTQYINVLEHDVPFVSSDLLLKAATRQFMVELQLRGL